MRKMFLFSALLGAALAYGTGCGSDDSSGGSGGSTATSSTSDTTSSTSGSGGGSTTGTTSSTSGSGGSGGDASTTATTSTTGAGGAGGGMAAELVNGCDPATAEDHTADGTTTVNQAGFAYTPKCIKIAKGSSVKFVATFSSHPLEGGTVENGAKVPDANSPITKTTTGSEATFAFPEAGAFGYYCDFHALSGMVGAVFVE